MTKQNKSAELANESGEIPSLDGWRAVAIIIVFLSHAGLGNIIPGGLGVTIFFFLSGYLITTLLCREHSRNGSISIKNFYIRRVLRLTPPLLATLIICYSLAHLGIFKGNISIYGFLAQLFYFANFYSLYFDPGNTTPAGTGVFWSLAVEEHFYLVFPCIFLALYQTKQKTKFALTLSIICAAVLAWRCILVFILHANTERTYYATDTRIDSIVFGCLLAILKNPTNKKTVQHTCKTYDYVIFSAGLILLLSTLLIRNIDFRETVRYTIQGIALAPLFYYSILFQNRTPFTILNSNAMRQIGKYSYSIYLIHYILIENLAKATPYRTTNAIIAIALSIGYAFLIDRHIDKPFHSLRKKFR
jgi:peptidoglycan/LPS O-acetylase OafA/YrhL